MPPKKDEKGKKGAKGGAALKEINPADYVRKVIALIINACSDQLKYFFSLSGCVSGCSPTANRPIGIKIIRSDKEY